MFHKTHKVLKGSTVYFIKQNKEFTQTIVQLQQQFNAHEQKSSSTVAPKPNISRPVAHDYGPIMPVRPFVMISCNSILFSLYIILVQKPCKSSIFTIYQNEVLKFLCMLPIPFCFVFFFQHLLMWYVSFTQLQYLVVYPLIITKVNGHFITNI